MYLQQVETCGKTAQRHLQLLARQGEGCGYFVQLPSIDAEQRECAVDEGDPDSVRIELVIGYWLSVSR